MAKGEAAGPRWRRASRHWDGGVQETKGCPLVEGSSWEGVREIFVKSGSKANPWEAFVLTTPSVDRPVGKNTPCLELMWSVARVPS